MKKFLVNRIVIASDKERKLFLRYQFYYSAII